jgi:hypothetical protein
MKSFLFYAYISLAVYAHGTEWFASPSASLTGNGSKTNPWPLQVALTKNTVIQPGDTLNLRGGNYIGNFVSKLNGATVRSYPGEWAVLQDGIIGTLLTDMNAVTDPAHIVIGNSEKWSIAQAIIIDGEHMQLGDNSTGTNWWVNRGRDGYAMTNHLAGARVIIAAGIINHMGSNTVFRDFEITSQLSTNRMVGTNWTFGGGLQLASPYTGNKAINLIIHNTGQAAIGGAHNSEINGCIIWGTGMYETSRDFPNGTTRGSAIYAQNCEGDGLSTVKNCISFRNFTGAMKVYSETSPQVNFHFIGNITFQNETGLQVGSGATTGTTTNIWFDGNTMMDVPMLSYQSWSNRNQRFVNNVVVNGGFSVGEHTDSVYTNNTVLFPASNYAANPTWRVIQFGNAHSRKAALKIIWDWNTYYIARNTIAYPFKFSTTDTNTIGFNYFPTWQAVSGFDAHSTCNNLFVSQESLIATNGWPTNYLKLEVQRLDYDSNQWHICVVSTSGQTNTTFTPSSYGLASGSTYQIIDAQNWPVVIASGTYGGGTLNLPLNLTNVSVIPGLTQFAGTGGHPVQPNQHTDISDPGLFNAFVLQRTAPQGPPLTNSPPTNLHAIIPQPPGG